MIMKLLVVVSLFLCMCGVKNSPIKRIIGKGLVPCNWMYQSDSTNTYDGQTWYFYANVLPTDSVTVIGEECLGELGTTYAFIVHNRNSRSHDTFSEEYIRQWRDKRVSEIQKLEGHVSLENMDSSLMEKFRGYWLYVYKYRGEFYLHQRWDCLIAYELTDSTWVQIDMEVLPNKICGLQGNENIFYLQYNNGRKDIFRRVDATREIYRVNENAYMIPARCYRKFELIAYCTTVEGLHDYSVSFDED